MEGYNARAPSDQTRFCCLAERDGDEEDDDDFDEDEGGEEAADVVSCIAGRGSWQWPACAYIGTNPWLAWYATGYVIQAINGMARVASGLDLGQTTIRQTSAPMINQ